MLGAGSRRDRLRLRLELIIASQWWPRWVMRHPGCVCGGGLEQGDRSRGRPSLEVGGDVTRSPKRFLGPLTGSLTGPLKLRQPLPCLAP